MSSPAVSVIVTTFNRREQLRETLLSILNQSFRDIEVLVMDNYSNYDITALINELADPRIRLYRNQNNGIIAVNRNFGLRQATGTYIAFCDDDDLWHPEKLAEQMKCFSNEQCGLSFTRIEFIDEQSAPLQREYTFRSYYNKLDFNSFILSLGFICNSSVVISRRAMEQVGVLSEEPRLRTVEDYHYWARIIKKFKACYVDKALVQYRIQQQSGTNSVNPKQWYQKQRYLLGAIRSEVGVSSMVYVAKSLKILMYYLKLRAAGTTRRSS